MATDLAALATPTGDRSDGAGGGGGNTDSLVSRSLTVGLWTLASRLTGFVRVAVIAAVLGPTFFGNLFQTSNQLPNVVFELAVGQLIASLLVPAMVRHVDFGRDRGAQRVACGFLGLVVGGFAAVGLIIAVAAPVLLRLFSAGVDDPSVVSDQVRLGWPLIALVMPQLALYGTIGVANAVQNTQRRFALAAAAPVVENIGVVATLLAYGALYGSGTVLSDAGLSEVMFLGIGSTLSVAAHAGVQWWGARRAGVRLRPAAGWRDPEVRVVARLALPSMGLAVLTGYQSVVVLVVAGRVAGGVVASQLALSFVAALVAVGARPVAVASLPELARIHLDDHHHEFRRVYLRALVLALFVLTPAAVILGVLRQPVAVAVSFGEMGPEGVRLVAAILPWVALAVIGEGALTVATHASYARRDARTPFRAAFVRGVLLTGGGVAAFNATSATKTLRMLGMAVSLSVVVSFLVVHFVGLRAPERDSSPASERELPLRLLRTLASAGAAGGVAWLIAQALTNATMPSRLVAVSAGLPALVVYGVIQLFTGAPELGSVRRSLLGARATERPARAEPIPARSVEGGVATTPLPAPGWRDGYRQRRRRQNRVIVAVGVLSAFGAGAVAAGRPMMMAVSWAGAVGLLLGSRWAHAHLVLVVGLSALATTSQAGPTAHGMLGAGAAAVALGTYHVGKRPRSPVGLARADWLAAFCTFGALSLVRGPTFSAVAIGVSFVVYVALRLLPGLPQPLPLLAATAVGMAIGLVLGASRGLALRPDVHLLMVLGPLLVWVSWRERRRRLA